MNKKTYLVAAILILSLALTGCSGAKMPEEPVAPPPTTPTPIETPAPIEAPEPVACTMDAKLCPDGSYVGRVAPDCKFEACPGSAGIANPASVNCGKQGGKSEIITNADGSQSGNCTLKNGTVCEEWAYFRGDCK